MAPGKDNLSESVSVLTQRQLDKFVQEYRIPLDLHPVLPSKNETIYPFRQGKFPLYTRVYNFANYRVPFSRFFIRVLQFFRVHICQVNPFGLSRINHFEVSCRAQYQRPDLDVFRYFYEFITAGDWYTFAHRKGIPPPSEDERSSLKNWKDIFFWLDDRCLPVEMVWRFKDQTMSFDLGEDFVFNKELARALIKHKSPIYPLPEHLLLWGRVCFSWGRGDRDWPVIHTKREFLLCNKWLRQLRRFVPRLVKALPILPTDATSSAEKTVKEATGSSGSQAKKGSILDDVDNDPAVRSLDEALKYQASFGSLKSKGVTSDVEPKGFIHKRKNEALQIRSSDPLPMPRVKKNKKSSSHTSDNVIIELDKHLSGGKSSREKAALARSAPTPAFSGGYLPVNETENIEIEDQGIEDGKTQSETKMVTFSDVFSDDMEIDPATADEKFIPKWDIRNKDSVMDDLVARTFLFNISTPRDHARSRKMKNQDLVTAVLPNQAQSNVYVTELYLRWVEAESVRQNLEKETLSLKRKTQRTPDAEKKLSQLSQDLQAQKEEVKSLTTQNQSSQAAAASASEERDKIAAELKSFVESSKKKDEA
ncbi:hypothetical protein Hdeb2414_s0016g00494581 [Helianthus debilis subsp. tardiflorus]